jgi:hypothetical protein
LNLDNDDVDVANNQQLCEFPTVPAQFSLDIYQPFTAYLQSKYGDEEEINLNRQEELDYVLSLGIEKAKEKLQFKMYPILFEDKKPRQDVMDKLVSIAKEFKSHPEYPIIKSMSITNIIDRVMDSKDKRTKRKYHKCIEKYVGEPKELGKTDVSGFIERIPNDFLNTTSSTSSVIEGSLDNEL